MEELSLSLVRESLSKRDHLPLDPADVRSANAEHVADDLKRQWACEVSDEIHLTTLDDCLEQFVCRRLDRLAVPVDRARPEKPAERATHHPVTFAVQGDHPASEHPEQLELRQTHERGQEIGAVQDLASTRIPASELPSAAQHAVPVLQPRRGQQAFDEQLVARRACVECSDGLHSSRRRAYASAFLVTTAIVSCSSPVGLNSIVSVPGSAAGVCPGGA